MRRLPLSKIHVFVRREQQKCIDAFYEERRKAINEDLTAEERQQADRLANIHYGEVMAYETVLKKVEEIGEEEE